MKHPNPLMQKNQDDFIKNCPPEQKAFHEQLFRMGNAAYIYHQQASEITNKQVSEEYFHEWLEGLPENIRNDMQKKGFEACKTMLPFTRYINERCDIGMDEWMKKHLSEDDFKAWQDAGKSKI